MARKKRIRPARRLARIQEIGGITTGGVIRQLGSDCPHVPSSRVHKGEALFVDDGNRNNYRSDVLNTNFMPYRIGGRRIEADITDLVLLVPPAGTDDVRIVGTVAREGTLRRQKIADGKAIV